MKLFDSIDTLTVAKHDQILAEKNLIYLIQDCSYFDWSKLRAWSIERYYKLKATFGKIQNDFVSSLGLSEDYIMYMELERELLVLKCEHLITEDNFILNDIREIERQIKQSKPKKSDKTLTFELLQISKYLGYEINAENTSLRKFISTKKAFNLQLKEDIKNSKKEK